MRILPFTLAALLLIAAPAFASQNAAVDTRNFPPAVGSMPPIPKVTVASPTMGPNGITGAQTAPTTTAKPQATTTGPTRLDVQDAWAEATTPDNSPVRVIRPNTTESMAYMTLTNTTKDDVVITDFATPAAQHVMAHETKVVGGIASMNPLTPLTIAPGKRFVFTPHAAHIMLMGLTAPLAPGRKFPLTIIFKDGASQTIDVTIKR